MSFTGVQLFMAIWLLLSFVGSISRSVHSGKASGHATLFVMLDITQYVGVVCALKVGGFW